MDRTFGPRALAATVALGLALAPAALPGVAEPADDRPTEVEEAIGGGALGEVDALGRETVEGLEQAAGEIEDEEPAEAGGDVEEEMAEEAGVGEEAAEEAAKPEAPVGSEATEAGELEEDASEGKLAVMTEDASETAEPVEDAEEPSDEEAPDLGGDMSVSSKRATAGDMLTFTLRVSDDSGAVSGSMCLRNVETGQVRLLASLSNYHEDYSTDPATVVVDGDEATDQVRVTDAWDPGQWVATEVHLLDRSGNSVSYYAPGYEPAGGAPSDWQAADLSALSFEVYGTRQDTEAPALGAASVSVKKVAAGGNVTMTLKTEGHDVAEAAIVYRAPQSGTSVPVELAAKSEGVMAGSMAITEQTELGTWEAEAIEWTDGEGEAHTVANTAISGLDAMGARALMARAAGNGQDVLGSDEADLSGLTFEVVRPEELNPAPEQPTEPTEPEQPEQPAEPAAPEQPGTPEQPTRPTVPAQPTAPAAPAQPAIAQTGDETVSTFPVVAVSAAILGLGAAVLAFARRLARR